MDQLHTANKVCGGCCAISLNTVDTESSVSPIIRMSDERLPTNVFYRELQDENLLIESYEVVLPR